MKTLVHLRPEDQPRSFSLYLNSLQVIAPMAPMTSWMSVAVDSTPKLFGGTKSFRGGSRIACRVSSRSKALELKPTRSNVKRASEGQCFNNPTTLMQQASSCVVLCSRHDRPNHGELPAGIAALKSEFEQWAQSRSSSMFEATTLPTKGVQPLRVVKAAGKHGQNCSGSRKEGLRFHRSSPPGSWQLVPKSL